MRKEKVFLRVLLSVFAIAIMAGGCGGGGDTVPEQVSFEALNGRWSLYDGEGTVDVDGHPVSLGLVDYDGHVEFEMVTQGDKEAVFDVLVKISFEELIEGSYHLDSLSADTGKGKAVVSRAAYNKFLCKANYGTIEITFLSDTSASVEMNIQANVEASQVESRTDVTVKCNMKKAFPDTK
ncbi:MAG: hypothetical protein LBO21_06055 [Synergistaceae bacterium]|nr:hypothetical protein [Synergistaceae bacterium]